jgi:hypothetical protein
MDWCSGFILRGPKRNFTNAAREIKPAKSTPMSTDDLCKAGDFSVTIYTEASFEGNG